MKKEKEVKDAKVVEKVKEEATEVEETTPVEEEEVVETKKEEVKEEPKKKEKKDNDVLKVVLKRTWDFIFWGIILIILATWIVDFVNVKQNKEPQFCLKKETIQVENGTVDSCLGVGYKVFTYHTTKYDNARDFGPFWSEPRK